ncbi:MAG: phosphotransferase, partial [Actinomycetota bacterium]
GHVLKAYAKDRQFGAALTGLVASGRAPSLCTATYLAAFPDLRLTVQAAVEGAAPMEAVESAREAGDFIRLLQEQPLEGLSQASHGHQLHEAARHAFLAGVVVPGLQGRLRELIDRLGRCMPADGPLVPAHGDFHVDQLMVHDGSFTVIDFDGLCRAPAALDVATYAADVVRGRGNDGDRIEAVLEPLLDGYRGVPDGLSWYLCTAVLCRATHPFRAQAAAWPDRIEAMVESAEEALEP